MLPYRLDRCRSYSAASCLSILCAVLTEMHMSRTDVITLLSDLTAQTSKLRRRAASEGYKAADQKLHVTVFTAEHSDLTNLKFVCDL
jgi:hypothetical protein